MGHFWVELQIAKRIYIAILPPYVRIFVQYLITFNSGKIGQCAKAIAGQNGLS